MAVLRAGPGVAETKKAEEKADDGRVKLFGRGPGMPKRRFYILIALAVAALAVIAWVLFSGPDVPRGFARGNGRLEANEVYIASKYPGRVAEVLVDEGDTVEANQVLARMDTDTLEAQLNQALAQIAEAESNRAVALAQIQVRQADFNYATQQYSRSRALVGRGAVSEQEAQVDSARRLAAQAELVGARAQVTQAQSAIQAAQAEAQRLREEIEDSVLVAPIRGRVETRLAEPGEVLEAGGRVLSIIDLSDVYMYVFLPESATGRILLGSEARIVLDAAEDYPIRATVSFVSPQAQFTPRAVETEEERHNLTFRVKLQLDPARLREVEPLVKSGLPGVGYVRIDQNVAWPSSLAPRALPANIWQPTGAAPRAPQGTPR